MDTKYENTFFCERCKLHVSTLGRAWYSIVDKKKSIRHCSVCYFYLQNREKHPRAIEHEHEHNSKGPVMGYSSFPPVWICASCQVPFQKAVQWLN